MMKFAVEKLLSGRFWCLMIFACTMSYLAVIEGSVRDAFFALAGACVRDYFAIKREDKKNETNNVPPG